MAAAYVDEIYGSFRSAVDAGYDEAQPLLDRVSELLQPKESSRPLAD